MAMENLGAEKKKVVVIGGGVGGSLVAKTLQNHADVFLIDSKEYFEITWASLRSMVEPTFAKRSVMNHSEYLPNAHVITTSAIDLTDNEVLTAQGRAIAYDYLVIATGHQDNGAFTKAEKLQQYQAGKTVLYSIVDSISDPLYLSHLTSTVPPFNNGCGLARVMDIPGQVQ